VSAGDRVDFEAQAVGGDALLEIPREEPILAWEKHARGDLGQLS